MRVTADRIALLVSYGLSEYQAKAYLALLEYPASTAGDLAKVSRIPRNRLYDILADLQAMGLAQIYLEGTRKYRANPLSVYLDRRIEDLKNHIKDIESRKQILDVAFQPAPKDPSGELGGGTTRVLLGRRSVAREIDRMLAGAKRDVVAIASTGGVQRLAGYLRTALGEGAAPDGPASAVKVHVLVPDGVPALGILDPLAGLISGGIHRVRAPLRMSAFIVDGQEMLLVQPIPDDARLNIGEDFALLTSNGALLADYLNLARAALTPDEIIAKA